MSDREAPTTPNDAGLKILHRNTIREACQLTRLSRATLYERIAAGLLNVIKDGRRTFISGEEIERYLKGAR